MKHLLAIALIAAPLLSGCALTSRGTPLEIRYFSLEAQAPASASAPRAEAEAPLQLRVASVGAATHLRERLVFRETPYELGFYESRRWSERPDAFLRRALQSALFVEGHTQQAIGGNAPALDVMLLSLEELRGEKPKVRAQISVSLLDGLHVVLEKTLTVERPFAAGDDVGPLIAAYDEALRQLVADTRDAVWQALEKLPSARAEAIAPTPSAAADPSLESNRDRTPHPWPDPRPRGPRPPSGASSASAQRCAGLTGSALIRCRRTPGF